MFLLSLQLWRSYKATVWCCWTLWWIMSVYSSNAGTLWWTNLLSDFIGGVGGWSATYHCPTPFVLALSIVMVRNCYVCNITGMLSQTPCNKSCSGWFHERESALYHQNQLRFSLDVYVAKIWMAIRRQYSDTGNSNSLLSQSLLSDSNSLLFAVKF